MSRSLLPDHDALVQWQAIQALSLARNSLLDLTGALVATQSHFAQVLEGEVSALQEVMTSIRADTRHSNIVEAPPTPSEAARFPTWQMACFPPSSFTSRHLQPLIARHPEPLTPDEVCRVVDFISRLVPHTAKAPIF